MFSLLYKTAFYALALFLLILISQISLARSTINRPGTWQVFTINGDFKKNSNWHYLYETQARTYLSGKVLDQYFNQFALGYSLNKLTQLWLGYDYRLIGLQNGLQNQVFHEQRIWYQLLRDFFDEEDEFDLTSRTRLEERIRIGQPGIGWRLRQRITAKIPLVPSKNIKYVMYHEIMFNLNHPIWVNPFLIDENRFFSGFEFPFVGKTTFTLGYLNQIFFRAANTQINHIVFLQLAVNF